MPFISLSSFFSLFSLYLGYQAGRIQTPGRFTGAPKFSPPTGLLLPFGSDSPLLCSPELPQHPLRPADLLQTSLLDEDIVARPVAQLFHENIYPCRQSGGNGCCAIPRIISQGTTLDDANLDQRYSLVLDIITYRLSITRVARLKQTCQSKYIQYHLKV